MAYFDVVLNKAIDLDKLTADEFVVGNEIKICRSAGENKLLRNLKEKDTVRIHYTRAVQYIPSIEPAHTTTCDIWQLHHKCPDILGFRIDTHPILIEKSSNTLEILTDDISQLHYVIVLTGSPGSGSDAIKFQLAFNYEHGIGVEQDPEKALVWYQLVSGGQHTADAEKAVARLMLHDAEEDDASAQYWVAKNYFSKDTSSDDQIAIRWCKKSADQGFADAQYELGNAYAKGRAVELTETHAANWFKKAADQGQRNAQYALGNAYSSGKGIALDLEAAAHWYQEAAAKGCLLSQYALGFCFENGVGVPRDIVVAATWWFRACAVTENEDGECEHDFWAWASDPKSVEVTLFAIAKLHQLYSSDAWDNINDPRKLDLPNSPPDIHKIEEMVNESGDSDLWYINGKVHEIGAGVSQNVLEAADIYKDILYCELEGPSTTLEAIDALFVSDRWKSTTMTEREKTDAEFVETHQLNFFTIPSVVRKYFQKTHLVKMAEDLLRYLNNEIEAPKLNFSRKWFDPYFATVDEDKKCLEEFLEPPLPDEIADPDNKNRLEGDHCGYVYILINSAFPNLLKIGRTTRTPQERADELSASTGVPYPFVVAHYEKVIDPVAVEREAHNALAKYRSSNSREFFELDIMEAKKIILEISDKYRS